MKAKADLTDKRFGRLVVKKFLRQGDNGVLFWLCQCDCGNEKTMSTKQLHSKRIVSCGCIRLENLRQKHDLAGQKFGRLTAIESIQRGGKTYWKCKCECGKEKLVRGDCLTSGGTRSCGCFNSESTSNRIQHGDGRRGKSVRLYRIWINIKQRCENPKNDNYIYYGERGIKICKEWHDYTLFKSWALQNGYNDNLSIDRIDVNGNYEPSNCQWVTMKVQANNTRWNNNITWHGETKTRTQWAEYFGILPSSLDNYRWRNKCDYERTLEHFAERCRINSFDRTSAL
jgi:hypothetical protein